MPQINAAEFASWLAERAAGIWWSVDGDEQLAGELLLPCTGEDLAAVIRRRGGRIEVVPPAGAALEPGELTRANVEQAAEHEGGARVFQLAWATPDGQGEPWLLVEDTLAPSA